MARKTKGNKPNQKGRSKNGPQFIKFTYPMGKSDAWRSLNGNSQRVWFEIRMKFNGSNNGLLSLSFREASKTLNISKSTVKAAFDELIEKGFLIRRREGQWYGRRAAEYICTDCKYNNQPPSKNWEQWKPPKEQKKQKPVRKSNANQADGSDVVPKEVARFAQSTRQPNLRIIDGSK